MIKTTTIAAGAVLALAAATATPAAAQDWQGPYVGGHLGYGFQPDDDDERILFDTDLDGQFGDTVRTGAGADAFSPGFCGGRATGPTPADGCDDDDDGAEFGLRAGYDWQMGSWVVGAVGEIGRPDITDSVSGFSTTPARYTFTREIENIAALRGRLGYDAGRFLPYVTAGFASAEVEGTYSTSNGANSFTPVSVSDRRSGYQLGAGVETWVTSNMTVGVEYLYTSLDDDDYIVRTGPGTAPATNPFLLVDPAGTDQRRSDGDFDFHAVRVTAAWRF